MSGTLTREELARVVAADIAPGSFVNLGIGQPTLVSNSLTPEQHITLHTENGMLGMGPEAHGSEIDEDLINAGKGPVTELPGAREMYVMMNLFDRDGAPKLVPECSYPLTGIRCVSRLYTSEAVFLVTPDGVRVRELFGSTTFEELSATLEVPLLEP